MARLMYELPILLDLIIAQCKQLIPYWLLGTLIGSVFSVYATKRIAQLAARMENKKYSFIQVFIASILGVASPVCMYGTIPMIAVLGRKNIPQYVLVTFMISSILLNPNLFLIGFALGAPLALLRFFISIAGGIVGGTLVFIFFKHKNFFNFSSFGSYANNDTTGTRKNYIQDVVKSMRITAPYLIIGIVLTALFDRYFPPEIMDALFLKNKALSVLFMASAGVPVYVCGGGTIPLLKAWLNAGMSVGSAVAFMLSGPATKLTNLGAVKIILGTRNFMLYICYSLLFAILAGLLTDFVLAIN